MLKHLNRLQIFLGYGKPKPKDINEIPIAEIRNYDLMQISLIMPGLIEDFAFRPFFSRVLLFRQVQALDERYEQLTGTRWSQAFYDPHKKFIKSWPNDEDDLILRRLEERYPDFAGSN